MFVLRRDALNADQEGAQFPQVAEAEGKARGFLDTWRMGLAVTRKTGTAVVRNRVKRVLREFFRLHGGILPCGTDIVVTPKRALNPDRITLRFVEQELAPVLKLATQLPGRGNSRI